MKLFYLINKALIIGIQPVIAMIAALLLSLLSSHVALAVSEPDSSLKPRVETFSAKSNPAALPFTAPENVGEIILKTSQQELPADGKAAVEIMLTLKDTNGFPVKETQYVSVYVNGGELVIEEKDKFPGRLEERATDRATRIRQLKVERGQARFKLISPTSPQDVSVRLIAGAASANTTIRFVPELRELIAVGLVEGIISQSRTEANQPGQAHINDGFEKEMNRWSRSLGADKRGAVRSSVFAKGLIADKTLLTFAYDSEKTPASRLMRDSNPEKFYPIYGDESKRGMDARSSDRLYARIDREKNYLLYGDFATGDGFSQASGAGRLAGLKLRDLGQYNRSATGLRAHYEQGKVLANTFAIYDNLKQAIEEFPTNGTSGPFAVKNNSAVENSEKIEIIVRDKNQLGLVKSVTPLIRYVDYTFEPFSGRILLISPVASLAPNGDPQFIRITYEVDQGGERFWVVGADGQIQLTPMTAVGSSWVEDKNPLSPYRLSSANLQLQLDQHTTLIAEVARSETAQYQVNGQTYALPTNQANERRTDSVGNAYRIELAHADAKWNGKLYTIRTESDFINNAASLDQGRAENGAKFALQLTDQQKLYAEALRSRDDNTGGTRTAAQIGVNLRPYNQLTVNLGLTHTREDTLMPATALIGSNSSLLGNGLSNTGGFFGGSEINPALASTLNTSTNQLTQALEATTAKVGLQYHVNSQLTVNGELEKGIRSDKQERVTLSSGYQINQQVRAYARYETQAGLASAYSLNPADKSTSFIAGLSSAYMKGGDLFSEYRLQHNAADQGHSLRDMAVASGERHTWNVADGVVAQTSVEYLKILSGTAQNALALTAGVDYSANPLWRASGKLEYRRVFGSNDSYAQPAQNQWLSTLSFARKLAQDWTFLARNYLLYTEKNTDSSGISTGAGIQDRAQLGIAWRPTDNNRYNALARYEYKIINEQTSAGGDNYAAHVLSVHGDYHPGRPWWSTMRVAAKYVADKTLPTDSQRYLAWLVGGRLTRDLNKKWDLGVMAASLNSPQGGSQQYAYGVEIGHIVTKNLWVSAGYNVSGFSDRDLTGSDYTKKGIYLRLRFKFDESLFKFAKKD